MILEGPTFSFAWVVDGVLETAGLELGILDSITRRLVIADSPSLGNRGRRGSVRPGPPAKRHRSLGDLDRQAGSTGDRGRGMDLLGGGGRRPRSTRRCYGAGSGERPAVHDRQIAEGLADHLGQPGPGENLVEARAR